jgi:hypothetical protein
MINGIVSKEQKVRKHIHISRNCKRIGLRYPNLKVQQGVIKATQAYTTGRESLRSHLKKKYIAGATNKSG